MTTADIQAEINRLSIKMTSSTEQTKPIYEDAINELKSLIPKKVTLHKAEESLCEACE